MTLDTPDRHVFGMRTTRPVEDVLREIREATRPRVAAWQEEQTASRATWKGYEPAADECGRRFEKHGRTGLCWRAKGHGGGCVGPQVSEARVVDEGVPLKPPAIPKHESVVVEAVLVRETEDAFFYRCLLRTSDRWVTMSVPK